MTFNCKYKLELEDCITSAKYVYKSQKRKQDKVIAVLIPILMLALVAMLVFDIVKHRSLVWDIILLVALAVLEAVYLIIPLTVSSSQKKFFKSQKLADMDYILISIDDNICTASLFKDGAEQSKNVHNLKALTSYIEDNFRLVLVFNKVEFVCIRKDKLEGNLNQLKAHIEKAMSKSVNKKK